MNDRLTLVTHAVSAAQLCDHSQDEHDGRAPPDQPGRHHPPRTLTTDNAISGYIATSKTATARFKSVACSAIRSLSASGFVKRSR